MSGAVTAPTAGARPFVTGLRTPRGAVLRVGDGGDRVMLRVQFEALWDAIVVDASADAPMAAVVRGTLQRFGCADALLSDFVVKLRGFEVKGEATVASSGACDGSTLLVAHVRRRPVR